MHVWIHTAKPGIIIGRKGANVNQLRTRLQEVTNKRVKVDVTEITRPEIDAYLVAESIAEQIERRISHKRAMKQAVTRAMRQGAEGVMITVAGRLSGSEMARRETQREGQVPRHTLRADIDYAHAEALTTFGRIGIKVWIYKGQVLPEKAAQAAQVLLRPPRLPVDAALTATAGCCAGMLSMTLGQGQCQRQPSRGDVVPC